jgi:hypothetical protein
MVADDAARPALRSPLAAFCLYPVRILAFRVEQAVRACSVELGRVIV